MPMPLVTAAVALALGARPLVPAAAGSSPPSGPWQWPLAGVPVVARPFEPPPAPWAAGHRGVDLAAPPESPVVAAGAGVVSFAGYVAGTGVVSVRHAGGLRTTYEPVLPAVRVGTTVAAGDLIGHLMPGHGDCGPARWCLHWGLLRGSTYLDPLTLLRRGPVRLLPLPADDVAEPAAGALVREAPPLLGPRVDVTRLPETEPPATSILVRGPASSAASRGAAAQFPETGTPATSAPARAPAPRRFRATALGAWLSGGAGVTGLLAWWATRDPLRRGALACRGASTGQARRRRHRAAIPRPS